MNKEQIEKLIKNLGKVKRVEPVGHKAYDLVSPVRLGDVLEKMNNDEQVFDNLQVRLCMLWQPLGFKKSLQEISNNEEAQELFEFLNTIFN